MAHIERLGVVFYQRQDHTDQVWKGASFESRVGCAWTPFDRRRLCQTLTHL
jgi:hypothetical protein